MCKKNKYEESCKRDKKNIEKKKKRKQEEEEEEIRR